MPLSWLLKNEKLWMVVGVIVVVGAIWLGILGYGKGRYNEGRAVEKAVWEQAMAEAQARALAAQQALDALTEQRDAASQVRTETRVVMVRQGRQEILNETDAAARYAAYVAFRDRLRTSGAADFDRARTSYLSAVGIDS